MKGSVSIFFSLLLVCISIFSLIIPTAKGKFRVIQSSFDSPNLGIVSIAASKNVVGLGRRLSLGINVTNYGTETETFNATFYANSTIIREISNITIEGQNSTIVAFKWTTTGFTYGNYSISVYISPVADETDLSDNFIGNLWIFVTITGDINADKMVDLYDAIIFASLFGKDYHVMVYPWSPPLSPLQAIADVDDNGIIDIYDAVVLAGNVGRYWT